MSYRQHRGQQDSLLPPSSYDVLGVSPTATDTEIKLAYKRLVLQWHPDRGLHDHSLAEQNLKTINEAYSKIKTRPARDQYNQILRLQQKADMLSRLRPTPKWPQISGWNTTWDIFWNWLTKLESSRK